MKKLIICLAVLSAGLTSCDDFLTEEPALTQSNELSLKDYDGLYTATAGLYARFQSYGWFGCSNILTPELCGGNARNPITFDGSGRYRVQATWNFNENSTWGSWYYSYYTIVAANNIIDNCEGKTTATISQQDIDNLKAEALAVRAFCYFNLVNVHGLPYTEDPQSLGVPVVLGHEIGTPARNTVAEVFAQIEKDLTEAEDLIEDNYTKANANDAKAYFTKPAIQALLSRVYLYEGKWQQCADYATKVINSKQYNLLSGEDYLAMFTQDVAKKGDEIILEVYGSNKNSYWDGSGWEHIAYVTTLDAVEGSADVCASEDLVKLFDANDIRSQLYELKNNQDFACLKYAGKAGSSIPKENNIPLIRFAEMYLNRAEAIFHGASVSGVSADADLNTLAIARGTKASSSANVLVDRRKELAFEGHIFFDLKRNKQGVTRTDNGGVDVPYSNRWAMPIPKSECDANPNMVQNEYYK